MNEKLSSELITINMARAYLKCSTGFLWLRRKEGKIKAVKAGKKVLLVKSSLDSFIGLPESIVEVNR